MTALLLAALAVAGPLEDPRIDTLEAAIARHQTGLALDDAPEVYHLRYHLMELEQIDATASFGALLRETTSPFNALAVEVRVGEPAFDNTNFGGWQTGFSRVGLPEQLTMRTLSLAAWRLTDTAYKEAVEQHARKSAQFTAPPDYPGDYTLTDAPTIADDGSAAISEAAPLHDIARAVSGALAVDPKVTRAEVYVGHEAGSLWMVDSEGARLRRPIHETSIRAVVHVRADDGLLLTDHLLWTVRGPEDLPPVEQMVAEAAATANDLVALADAEPFGDEYVGPVLFEDHAAVDLYRYVLLPQLEGTPGEIPFDTWLGDLGDSNDPVRLGRRVLPPGWTVVDDPQGDPSHPSSMKHDAEGTPTRRVDLVTDGIVREVLMTRTPRAGAGGSTGHARGSIGSRLSAHAVQTTITPDKPLPDKKLYKRAIKAASSYGRDYVLVVRRLQEPAVRRVGGAGGYFYIGDEGPKLPMPIDIVRRYGDGHEEPVRGVNFASVQRFVLRDVVGTGSQHGATILASSNGEPGMLAPTEGMPTWVSAPSVLVGEMELVGSPGDPRDTPLVPPPTMAVK